MRLSSKIVASILLAGGLFLVLAGVALGGPPWSDASDAWWVSSYHVTAADVATVADGYPDGTFKPASAVTRAQFAKMAVSGLGVEKADPSNATFKDVIPSNPMYSYIEGAYAAGLIGGYPTSSGLYYKPGSTITRQQADSILGRYLSQLEIDVTGAIHGEVTNYGTLDLWYKAEGNYYLSAFEDDGQIAGSHKANVAYLVYRGILLGSHGKLSPTASLNRAQAAVMILRVKAEADSIKTPPAAPTNLAVTATGAGMTVTYDSVGQRYVGNDSTPQVTGDTLASRPIAVYDEGVKLVEDSSNSAGKFYTDLTTPLAEGTHTFTAKVKNSNGLVSPASAPVIYVLDTTSPSALITKPSIPAGGSSATVNSRKPEFTATVTDDQSGVKQVEFQYSPNQATPAWQTISVDTSPDAGTSNYAAVWPTTGALAAGLSDGQYLFRIVALDYAGNQFVPTAVPVTVSTAKPTAVITAPIPVPAGIFYTEDMEPAFTAAASEQGGSGQELPSIAFVQFFAVPWNQGNNPTTWGGFLSGLISTDTTADYVATYPSPLPEGHYIFAVRATDSIAQESALMDGTSYATGVTQEVIIDRTAPVITLTSPTAGQQVVEGSTLTVRWNLYDITSPDTVKIEYTLDSTVATPVWTVAPGGAAAPNTGSFDWVVPDVDGDHTHVRVRITAVDKAAAHLDASRTASHTSQVASSDFTIYDTPAPVTYLVALDPDNSGSGVDGRDFKASWTLSTSTTIVSESLYILPATVPELDLNVHQPIVVFPGNTVSSWDGTASVVADSRGTPLTAGTYVIWVVVTDSRGQTAVTASNTFVAEAP
jgi:hypothetical protein